MAIPIHHWIESSKWNLKNYVLKNPLKKPKEIENLRK